VADADCIVEIERLGGRHEIVSEHLPRIRRSRLVAPSVSAEIDSDGAAAGAPPDEFVPTTAVESGSVGQQQRRTFAGPVPHGHPDAAGVDIFEFGRGH
jgi:hypothetical protein